MKVLLLEDEVHGFRIFGLSGELSNLLQDLIFECQMFDRLSVQTPPLTGQHTRGSASLMNRTSLIIARLALPVET